MDDTMSSYSFSHQFYQRWTCAPEPIRAAITQELKDITTLLQNDTPFESFVFSTHDLDAHLDDLYENHEAEQVIAKAISDKQAEKQAADEKQRVEEEQKKEAEKTTRQAEAILREQAEATQREQEKNKQPAITHSHTDQKVVATKIDQASADKSSVGSVESSANNPQLKIEQAISAVKDAENSVSDDNNTESKSFSAQARTLTDNHIQYINNKASTAINLALKDAKLSATHQKLIRELETQVDDYLSEQMMLMSENLKSWLRAEVTQHFSEQNISVTNDDTAKKNIH
ncbi:MULTISPECIES: hypothetical protein [unclassified Psychrobacter]|uniref:hypothetical protein n=1 Tax=unclassified Psychrobacter TaxID=196806 RepID=UPI0025B61CF6|nr:MULTISPECIES: hypothetical protein [unclassified Psychrobacter]MDN3452938.1 hypothetical protein [Psychrobacter sp. APC 3350]MDN3503014.1 hypothetical protein [Psychrobacter sp. 5A.1]